MKCPEARQLIKAHLDGGPVPAGPGEGAGTAQAASAFYTHLAQCGACAADFGLERAVSCALRESAAEATDPLTGALRAPEGFARSVAAAIEARAIEERRRGFRLRGYLLGIPAPWGTRHGRPPGAPGDTRGYPRGAPDLLGGSASAGRVGPGRRVSGWLAGWRPALAGAAAALLIAAGALGYGAQQWLERGLVIAHDPPGVAGKPTEQQPGPGPTGTESPTPGGGAEPETPGSGAGHTGKQAEPGQVPGATGAPGGTPVGGSNDAGRAPGGAGAPAPGPTQVAVAPVEPKVFLNKPRIMESTLIKLDVDDLVRARDTALLLSGDVGASCWPQVAQTNGAPVEVLRFNVDPAQAGFFVNKLIGLGQVSERRSDTRDITAEFAERLEQYRGLLAQRPRVTDPGEAATLDGRIASLEWQLTEWDREAGQHVVVLVLQQKT